MSDEETDIQFDDLDPQERLFRMRHSAAHVLAEAMLDMFPDAKYAIGPPIEHGFYYDFELPRPLTPDDLKEIEERMHRSAERDVPIVGQQIPLEEARRIFADQPYKLELIDDIEESTAGHFQHGAFEDLCRGGHTERTGQVGAFTLTHVAGAYWRGDEHRPMLQRVYGALYPTQDELDAYLESIKEAERRDHRKVGRELELFMSSDVLGQGLPILLPKGATVRRLLEEYILDLERLADYQHVYSPVLAKVELYETSGHWEHYRDEMFPPMSLEHEQMVLRPMNCPHHVLVYDVRLRSYRELPLRIAEIGNMYRYERSGVVGGLNRVRAMALNDAHIFCTPAQIKSEFAEIMRLVEEVYGTLGLGKYSYRLSLRDPNDTEKYVQKDEMWELGERVLREAMNELRLDYEEAPGEAAFYGPKLDIQIQDLFGREETLSTIQIDFHLPEQFGLSYVAEDGAQHSPVIIHRGVLGTMERLIAHLIEIYDGAFPLWLAPIQVVTIPIADRHADYATELASQLRDQKFRVEVDESNDRMGAKIRNAQLQKVPYMLIVGDREQENSEVSVRDRIAGDLGAMPVSMFFDRILEEQKDRGRENLEIEDATQ